MQEYALLDGTGHCCSRAAGSSLRRAGELSAHHTESFATALLKWTPGGLSFLIAFDERFLLRLHRSRNIFPPKTRAFLDLSLRR